MKRHNRWMVLLLAFCLLGLCLPPLPAQAAAGWAAFQRVPAGIKHGLFQRRGSEGPVVAALFRSGGQRSVEQLSPVQQSALARGGDRLQQIKAIPRRFQIGQSEGGQMAAHIFRHKTQKVFRMRRSARKAAAEFFLLRGDACRAVAFMAFAAHDATAAHQQSRAEPEFVRAENRRDDDVAPAAHTAVSLKPDSVAQTAGNECAVRLRQAEFPR